MWMSCQLNHFIWLSVIKDAFDYKSDMYKKTIHMFNYGSHMTKKELGVKSNCKLFIGC